MRRAVIGLAVVALFLPACFYKPVYVDPLTAPSGARRAANGGGGAQVCREISRTRCAADACRGANMDYVTLQCNGGRAVNRCVANLKCTAD
jgi:hypothetical protein